jgi:hypothetical protein
LQAWKVPTKVLTVSALKVNVSVCVVVVEVVGPNPEMSVLSVTVLVYGLFKMGLVGQTAAGVYTDVVTTENPKSETVLTLP